MFGIYWLRGPLRVARLVSGKPDRDATATATAIGDGAGVGVGAATNRRSLFDDQPHEQTAE